MGNGVTENVKCLGEMPESAPEGKGNALGNASGNALRELQQLLLLYIKYLMLRLSAYDFAYKRLCPEYFARLAILFRTVFFVTPTSSWF